MFMRAAFHRQLGNGILGVGAFDLAACRAAVLRYNDSNVDHAWIFLEVF
jgi:hypothetical protein